MQRAVDIFVGWPMSLADAFFTPTLDCTISARFIRGRPASVFPIADSRNDTEQHFIL